MPYSASPLEAWERSWDSWVEEHAWGSSAWVQISVESEACIEVPDVVWVGQPVLAEPQAWVAQPASAELSVES